MGVSGGVDKSFQDRISGIKYPGLFIGADIGVTQRVKEFVQLPDIQHLRRQFMHTGYPERINHH